MAIVTADRYVKLEEIESVFVHWSESELINAELGHDEEGDIDKKVDPIAFDDLVRRASALVPPGYDKTMLTVYLKDGGEITYVKFYLTREKDSLEKLINR